MNTSPVLLLILLLSACHGEEQTHSNTSSISATTELQVAETPPEVLCPDPTDIEPCVCDNPGGLLIMDCGDIQDEQQLWQVFSAYFPSTAFFKINIMGNEGLKVLENGVFHNVSFQEIYIWSSSVEAVEDEALTPSLSTLTSISIQRCPLVTFPFERLPEFTSLDLLTLYNNHNLSIPPLSSPTLEILGLAYNPISYFPPDVFKGLPVVRWIDLSHCQLMEITPETFKDLPKLNRLTLQDNRLSYLQNLTFDIASPPEHPGYLDLAFNNIDFVEEGAFEGVQESSMIVMSSNALTRLPERVWRPVLEKGITVTFGGNALTCGCDVAWLVRNPELLTVAQYGMCADGNYLADLDPADFSTCD